MQSNSETDIMKSWKWKLYHAMQMIQNTSACHKEVKRKFYIGIFSLICCIRRMFQFLCLPHNNRGSLLLSSFQMLPQFFWLYLLSFLSDDGGPFFIFFIWWCSAATLTRMRACLSFSHHLYRLFTTPPPPSYRTRTLQQMTHNFSSFSSGIPSETPFSPENFLVQKNFV